MDRRKEGILPLDLDIKVPVLKVMDGKETRDLFDRVLDLSKKHKDFPGGYCERSSEYPYDIRGGYAHWLVLANEVLRENGQRTITLGDSELLSRHNLLTCGVSRSIGLVVFSDGEPNANIAQALVEAGGQEGFELPYIVPYSSLKLSDDGSVFHLRRDYSFVESGKSVEERLRLLDKLHLPIRKEGLWRLDFGGALMRLTCKHDLTQSDERHVVDWIYSQHPYNDVLSMGDFGNKEYVAMDRVAHGKIFDTTEEVRRRKGRLDPNFLIDI